MNIRKQFSNFYTPAPPKLSFKEIDARAKEYQSSQDSKRRVELQTELLKTFHDYLLKYTLLLKGELENIRFTLKQSDTLEFLSLFLPRQSKSAADLLGITRYVARICESLEARDVYNELCLIFIKLLQNYEVRENVGFTHYITKYMRWAIKDWIMGMSKEPLCRFTSSIEEDAKESNPEHIVTIDDNILRVYARGSLRLLSSQEFYDPRPNDIRLQLPQLNLGWIRDPRNKFFATLKPYERFLLYLNYKEGLGVRQIGKRLGRTKDAINRHLQHILVKLRNLAGWKSF